jgi:hypothetical protein
VIYGPGIGTAAKTKANSRAGCEMKGRVKSLLTIGLSVPTHPHNHRINISPLKHLAMKSQKLLFLSLSVALATTAIAQSDTRDLDKEALQKELAAIKEQQRQMQDSFEKRIKSLEDKLAKQAAAPGSRNAPVVAGLGPIQFDGVAQGRFDTDSNGNDTFYLRRLELKFNGKISPKADWTIMIDPAKNLKLNSKSSGGSLTDASVDQSSRILQDAFLSYRFNPHLSADLGQKKIPFGYEALQSTSTLDVIERALFMTQGKYADVRDTGLFVNGTWPEIQATAAVLNGAGEVQNSKDTNAQKALAGRITFSPQMAKGLQLGISGITEQAADNTKHERVGADINYRADKLTLRAEYAAALQNQQRGFGWYAHAGYKFRPQWEAVARFDTFNPNRLSPNNREEDWLGGINYFVSSNSMLQVNYIHKRFFNGLPINNVLFANYQYKW